MKFVGLATSGRVAVDVKPIICSYLKLCKESQGASPQRKKVYISIMFDNFNLLLHFEQSSDLLFFFLPGVSNFPYADFFSTRQKFPK